MPRLIFQRVAIWSLILAGAVSPGVGHDLGAFRGEPPRWTVDPWIVTPLLFIAFLYLKGQSHLRGRSTRGLARLSRNMSYFAGGWLSLSIALISPLHQAGERSFTAHMFEHELIMLVAAPLFVLSEPLAVMLWAFPSAARRYIAAAAATPPLRQLWRLSTAPVIATLVQAAALWLWHAPALFDLALDSARWHAAQHLSFLVSALLFWTSMLSRRTPAPLAALCLVTTSIVSGALGAFMAFAPSPWYEGYARLGLSPFGLTPAEDQQLAGLLMWVPGGLVHAGAALILIRRMLSPRHA